MAGKKSAPPPPKKGDKGKKKPKSPPEKDIQHMLDVLIREVGDSPTDRDLDSRGISREWLTDERMTRAKEAAREWFLAQQKKNVDLLWRGPEEIADKDVGNIKRWYASAKDKDVFRVTEKGGEFAVERQSVKGWRFIGTDKQSRKKSLESALDWAEGYFMEDSLGSKRPTKSNRGDILPKREDKKPTLSASANGHPTKERKSVPSAGVDFLGARLGTNRARINALLSADKPLTMKQIMELLSLEETYYNHINALQREGVVDKTPTGYVLSKKGIALKKGDK
jgi:hypothetical protein